MATDLSPLKHKLTERFLSECCSLLPGILDSLSSPVHVVFPQVLVENIAKFKEAFSSQGLEPRIFFACKANKANSFIEAACDEGIGVEVSSYYELQNCLGRGIQGDHLIASGPGKTRRYLGLALRCGATVAVDSESELDRIIQITVASKRESHIFLRVANAVGQGRFGLEVPFSPGVLGTLKEHRQLLSLTGLSAHLPSYVAQDRVLLSRRLLTLCLELRSLGFSDCRTINIGGGFPINYVSRESWSAFKNEKNEFWNAKTFANYYPCFSELSAASGLKHILTVQDGNTTLAARLREEGLNIVIEPGQALLDQAGITVMRVTDLKRICGEYHILVDGNNDHVSERLFDTDLLVAPELLSFDENGIPMEGYVGGNSCMSQDMILWHKTRFPHTPREGDLLIFHNTAAYYMDSNESTFSRMPLPKKVCALVTGEGWRLSNDETITVADFKSHDT